MNNIIIKVPDEEQQARIINIARRVTKAFEENPNIAYVGLYATDNEGKEHYVGHVPNPAWRLMLPEIQDALNRASRLTIERTVEIKGK